MYEPSPAANAIIGTGDASFHIGHDHIISTSDSASIVVPHDFSLPSYGSLSHHHRTKDFGESNFAHHTRLPCNMPDVLISHMANLIGISDWITELRFLRFVRPCFRGGLFASIIRKIESPCVSKKVRPLETRSFLFRSTPLYRKAKTPAA